MMIQQVVIIRDGDACGRDKFPFLKTTITYPETLISHVPREGPEVVETDSQSPLHM